MLKHTCILDDGGTPNRSCEACTEERKQVTRRIVLCPEGCPEWKVSAGVCPHVYQDGEARK